MISLCMIVKNEENYLEGCLNSVKDVVDEIVIVDTGSSDSTKEIAEKYDANIFDYEWNNNFSDARNFSLQYAKGDWILYLDADERLNSGSVDLLKTIIEKENDAAFECRIVNIDDAGNRPSVMKYVRLFPNKEGVEFEGRIHEQIEPSLLKTGCKIQPSDIEITHLGYSIGDDELKLKAERNLSLLKVELDDNKSGYIYFQIGQTYHILEKEEEAIENFNKALEDKLLRDEYKATALRSIAVFNSDKNNYEQAVERIEESLKLDYNQPLSHLAASKIYLKTGRKDKAVQSVFKAYTLNNDLINGHIQSSQSILADTYTLIYNGLNVALMCNDNNTHKYFVDIFKKNICNNGHTQFYNIYGKLIANGILNNDEIIKLVEYADEVNLELLLNLLNKHNQINFVCNVFEKLENKFINNSYFLNIAGLKAAQNRDMFNAERLLNLSHTIDPMNSAAILYLVSVFIQQNKLKDAITIIEKNKDNFKDQPEVIGKFNLVLQKLIQTL